MARFIGRLSQVLFLTLFLGVSFSVLQSPVFSRQVDTFSIARSVNHQAGYYSFDGEGRLKTAISQTIANTNAMFFKDEVIQLEIELVDDQEAKLNSILSAWQASWEETIKGIQRDHKKAPLSRDQVRERIANNDEVSLAKIRKLLLPHQVAIINELQLRCLFRTQGLRTILDSPEFHKSLELSDADRDKLLKTARSTTQKTLQQSIEVRAKALAVLLESLSDDERQMLAEKWKHLFDDEHRCSLEELIVFLDAERYAWIDEDSDALEKLVGRPNFETGAAGNLITKPGNKYSNEKLSVFRSFWKNKEFADWVGLSADEQTQVQSLVKASYPSSSQILEMANEPTREGQKSNAEKFERMESESMAAIMEVLGDRWTRVETFAERINLASAGPVYDLIEGELSERMKFSPAKKDLLKEKAAEALKLLTTETGKIEESVLDEIASSLDEDRGKKFKAAFGRPVKNAPVNIDLMLMNMRR